MVTELGSHGVMIQNCFAISKGQINAKSFSHIICYSTSEECKVPGKSRIKRGQLTGTRNKHTLEQNGRDLSLRLDLYKHKRGGGPSGVCDVGKQEERERQRL